MHARVSACAMEDALVPVYAATKKQLQPNLHG
jgi:hypothetical protein